MKNKKLYILQEMDFDVLGGLCEITSSVYATEKAARTALIAKATSKLEAIGYSDDEIADMFEEDSDCWNSAQSFNDTFDDPDEEWSLFICEANDCTDNQ